MHESEHLEGGGRSFWREKSARFGLSGTAASVLIGILVWFQNRQGFREAEAFATLLGAIFSMIATVWLIVTILKQSEELRLQRNELKLQRNELKLQRDQLQRQAGEFEKQNLFNKMNIEFAVKRDIEFAIFNYLCTDHSRLVADQQSISKLVSEFLSSYFGFAVRSNEYSIREGSGFYFIVFERNLSDKLSHLCSTKVPKEVKITGKHLESMKRLYKDRVILNLFGTAQQYEIEDWFINFLPYTMKAIEGVSRSHIANSIRACVLPQ